MNQAEFDQWAEGLGLKFFRPHEVRFLGGSHYDHRSPAHGLNTLPPKRTLAKLGQVARVADVVRGEFLRPVRILSGYRSARYNAAVGGAKGSQHLLGAALDLAPLSGTVAELWAVCQRLRKAGTFVGGIGRSRGFVHIDVRGTNVDW